MATGGTNYTSTTASKKPYLDEYEAFKKNLENSRTKYLSDLANQETTNKNATNGSYDNANRQNYIKYMQQRRSLPDSLNRLGVNGGATESSLLRLQTAYGNQRNSNEQARNSALSSLAQKYTDLRSAYDQNYDTSLRNAYSTAQENQIKYDKEMEQQAYEREQARLKQEQEKRDKDLANFQATVARYRTEAEYRNWIKQIAASNDPDKDLRIKMIENQIIKQFPVVAAYSSGYGGGGGGGYYRRYSSGYSGGGGGYYSSGGSRSGGSSASRTVKSVGKAVTKSAKKAVSKKSTPKWKKTLRKLKGFMRG